MLEPPLTMVVLDSPLKNPLLSSILNALLEADRAAFLAANAYILLSVLDFLGTAAPSDPVK